MSIEVTGPDRAVHVFPDGTDPAVIKSAMARQYGAARPTFASVVGPNPVSRLSDDYHTRMRAADADVTGGLVDMAAAGEGTDSSVAGVSQYAAKAIPGGLRAVAGGASALWAPFGAFGDMVVGRPVSVAAKAAGVDVSPQTVTDIGSMALPLAGELNAMREARAGAEASGLTTTAYRQAVPAQTTARTIVAADAKRAAAAAKPPFSIATVAAPVRRAAAPFAAKVSQASAERQAGAAIAQRSSDLPAVRASLENGPDQIVPGSIPTTAQQTGDLGLGSLEREVAIKGQVTDPTTGQLTTGPELMAARRGEQNSARLDALGGVQSGGDPTDVSKFLKDQFDALDSQTQTHIDELTAAAQAKGGAIGGEAPPEATGAALRAAITSAEDAGRARTSALYDAVDPNGDLTGNTTATKTAADGILQEQPPTAKPMAGEEGAIFDAARGLPSIAPARDLIALRSRVSAEIRQQNLPTGDPQVLRRLTQLRGAIEDNLANSISERVASDQTKVAAGQLAAEDAFGAHIESARDAFLQSRRTEARANTGTGPVDYGGSGQGAVSSVAGAEVPSTGGPSNAAGNPGVSPDAGIPTFDAAAKGRLDEATQAYKAERRTFGLQPVSSVTAKAGASDIYRLPDGQVPGKFFHPGPAGYEHMQAAIKTSPDALPILEDHAASTLRRAAMRDDGTLDPAKFARWQASHQDALRAFPPETQARFADAAQASQAVAEASAGRAEAIKAARTGAAARLMGLTEPQDITRTVGSILGSRTSVQDMKALATQAGADPNALAGLRQAVADHIAGRLIGNTEAAASGLPTIKADVYQTFIRQNRAALETIFKPEEIDTFERIAADIQRAKRSETALKLPGGSNTAQDTYGVGRSTPAKGTRSFLSTVAGLVGLTHGGPLYAALDYLGASAIQSFRAAGIERVDQLVTRAMMDPAFAKELLKKVPVSASGTPPTVVIRARVRAMLRSLQVGAAISATQPQRRQTPSYAAAMGVQP